MLSAALVLQKAIITCMDCIEFAKKYVNNKNVQLWLWDPPYVELLGSTCTTYKVNKSIDLNIKKSRNYVKRLKSFNIDKFNEIAKLMAKTEGMAILTHDIKDEVEESCYQLVLHYLFEYDRNYIDRVYTTRVWGNRVELEDILQLEKFNKPNYSAYIDIEERELYKLRDDKILQYIAQLTNTTEGGEE